MEGLARLCATVPNSRSLSGSNTLNEFDFRSLVGELRTSGSESGLGVLGTESGSSHAESTSSRLIFQTSLIETELATGTIDAGIRSGSLDLKVNSGSSVLVGSVVLGVASGGLSADS